MNDLDLATEALNGDVWVYFLGERRGSTVKIGRNARTTMNPRVVEVVRDQHDNSEYVLLAAVRATPNEEAVLKRYFGACRQSRGRRTEYFNAVPELVEYVAWLREQFWCSIDEHEPIDDLPHMEATLWLPAPTRRVPPPTPDGAKIVQDWDALPGPLNGTAWSWMPNPRASFQDFFTPPPLVGACIHGMTGKGADYRGPEVVDLASHWAANRVHKFARYYHAGHSAFDEDWWGVGFLNPPYGNNAPWFERIIKYVDSGALDQICVLSPLWAFTTGIARPLMERTSAMLILVPTPRFWGNADGRTGINHPHAIAYVGDRPREVLTALTTPEPFGVPVRVAWDQVAPINELTPEVSDVS